jgi:hypothetical protein
MRTKFLAVATIALITAACSSPKGNTAAPQRDAIAPGDTAGGVVTFLEVNGEVKGVVDAHPLCPLKVQYYGKVQLGHLSGILRYRWMRSNGDSSALYSVRIPDRSKNDTAEVKLEEDVFPVDTKGEQISLKNRVHIVSPIERWSPEVEVELRCFGK